MGHSNYHYSAIIRLALSGGDKAATKTLLQHRACPAVFWRVQKRGNLDKAMAMSADDMDAVYLGRPTQCIVAPEPSFRSWHRATIEIISKGRRVKEKPRIRALENLCVANDTLSRANSPAPTSAD